MSIQRKADCPPGTTQGWDGFGFGEVPPNAALVLGRAPSERDVMILELSAARIGAGGRTLMQLTFTVTNVAVGDAVSLDFNDAAATAPISVQLTADGSAIVASTNVFVAPGSIRLTRRTGTVDPGLRARYTYRAMCRNIRTLFNFEPPVTDGEVQAASLQFVRKITGFHTPSQANAAAFHAAVDEIARVAHDLLDGLETSAAPKNRQEESAKAKARAARRFGT